MNNNMARVYLHADDGGLDASIIHQVSLFFVSAQFDRHCEFRAAGNITFIFVFIGATGFGSELATIRSLERKPAEVGEVHWRISHAL
jgi:hypothetical protein